MRKKLQGNTIVEVLVSAVLLLLLFSIIYSLLSPGFKYWMRSQKKVEIQQQTVISVYSITNELRESHQKSVTIKNYNPPTDHVSTLVCFASNRDKNGTIRTQQLQYGIGPPFDSGEPEWQKYVFYYLDDNSRLRRGETTDYLSYKAANSMQISIDPLNYIKINDLLSNRVIARKIESFSIDYDPGGTTWKGCLNMTLVSYDEENKFKTTLTTSVGVRYND
jgi:hypothetical protein